MRFIIQYLYAPLFKKYSPVSAATKPKFDGSSNKPLTWFALERPKRSTSKKLNNIKKILINENITKKL